MARIHKVLRWMAIPTAALLLLALAAVTPGDRVSAQIRGGEQIGMADGSVRTLSLGPVTMGMGDAARSRLLLPAVQKARAIVWILDGSGHVLFSTEYTTPPADPAGTPPRPFFDVFFELTVDERGTLMFGDGSVRKAIGSLAQPDDISVLIGLLLPAVQKVRDPSGRASFGTAQLTGERFGPGQLILPFIEQ